MIIVAAPSLLMPSFAGVPGWGAEADGVPASHRPVRGLHRRGRGLRRFRWLRRGLSGLWGTLEYRLSLR